MIKHLFLFTLLLLTAVLGAQDSPFLPRYEIRNKAGKTITVNTEKVTDTHLIGYAAGKRFEISWDTLDLKWLEENNNELYLKYKDAYDEALMFKTYDPSNDIKQAIIDLLKGMKSSNYEAWNFERDKVGRTIKIVRSDNDEVTIGRTYRHISKIVNNYGEDLRKESAIIDSSGNYVKAANGNKRMFTEEAKGLDDNMQELSGEIKRLHSRLEQLPNAKKSEQNVKLLTKLKAMADDVAKLRTSHAALDRSATERLKATLDEFDALTVTK